MGVAAVAVLLAVFAALRFTGQLPYGSDHDEYRLVAQSLLRSGTPVVGGVEATKYPLGYPLLLALLDGLGLPIGTAAIVVNVVLVAALAVVVVRLTAPLGARLAQLSAAAFVVTNVALWGSVYAVMPDVLFTLLVALVVARMVALESGRDVAVVAALVVSAASVKSVGLLVAVAASAGVLFGARRLRRWCWAPALAGLVAVGVQAVVTAPYPEPATGYARTFVLRNPYDAADGRASVAEVAARVVTRVDSVLTDVGAALTGASTPDTVAAVVALALLALGIVGLRRQRPFAVALVVVYAVGLTLWPFASVRFGLPLLPLAAVGVGVAAAWVFRVAPRAVGAVVVVAALGGLGVANGVAVRREAAAEAAMLASLHAATQEAVHWIDHNVERDEPIASLAYRELALRLDRPVLPLGYTSDTAALWSASGGRGARWFVNLTTLYPRRARHARRLVAAYPDRFERVFRNDEVAIYRIRP